MPTLVDEPWALFGLTALVVVAARTCVKQGAEALKARSAAMRHLRLMFDAGTPQFCWRAVLLGWARCAFTVYSELPRWRRHDDALPEFLPYAYGVVMTILFLLACMRWCGAASSGETVGDSNLRVAALTAPCASSSSTRSAAAWRASPACYSLPGAAPTA